MSKLFVSLAFCLFGSFSFGKTTEFRVRTLDGLYLQGKLDYTESEQPQPTIILLQGAGPINVDMALLEPNNPHATCSIGWENDCRIDKHLAKKLAGLGYAVVRVGKRGVWVDHQNPNYIRVNYQENASSTIDARMADFNQLMSKLKQFPRINLNQVHLVGVSEGTIIAQKLVPVLGSRLKGMVLVGAVLGSGKDLYRTQIVDVAYDLLLEVTDTNGDRVVSQNEYQYDLITNPPKNYDFFSPAFFKIYRDLAENDSEPTFSYFDRNEDGFIVRNEVQEKIYKNLYSPIVSAVESGDKEALSRIQDSDYSFKYNTLEQFQGWFSETSKAQTLAELSISVNILFGENDKNTSPRQLDWFLPLVWQANKESNIRYTTIVNEGHYGPLLAQRIIEVFSQRN